MAFRGCPIQGDLGVRYFSLPTSSGQASVGYGGLLSAQSAEFHRLAKAFEEVWLLHQTKVAMKDE